MRGLSKEPAKRYADVIEYAAEFKTAAGAAVDAEKKGIGAKLASLFSRARD